MESGTALQGTWELILAFWQGLPLLQMTGFILAGSTVGLVAGLAGAYLLQHRGWLQRRNRWHHLALKSYFLILPVLAILIGAQIGMSAAAHRAIDAQIDHFRPQVRAMAEGWMQDFVGTLDTGDFAALRNGDTTLLDVADTLVGEYLDAYPMLDAPWWHESRLRQQVHVQLSRFRVRLVSSLVTDQLVASATDHTGIHEAVFKHALETRLNNLLDSDLILDLLKQQVGQMMRPVYIGLLLQWLLLVAAVAMEWGISRYFGWSGLPPAAGR